MHDLEDILNVFFHMESEGSLARKNGRQLTPRTGLTAYSYPHAKWGDILTLSANTFGLPVQYYTFSLLLKLLP